MTGDIKEEIKKEYERIKDKIPYDDFLKKMEERKHDYEDVSFMSDLDIARTITGEYINEENTPLSEKNEQKKISELVSGQDNISVTGRIMHISNVKKFTSRKGKNGKLANIILADDTGEIRVVLWTNNIRCLKDVEEGDIVKVNSVEVKQGFREDELQMNMDSTIKKLPEDDEDIFKAFPKYDNSITPIKDIKGDTMVNVIAGIIRIPRIRSFDKNGKDGKVASLEIQDETGTIQYTLWNKDTNLIEDLKLKEGDSVKILGALGRERNGEISLSHSWLGRIIKGEFDVPKFTEKILKIGDAHEMRNVTVIGVVCKNYDKITFQRNDGTAGQVKSVEIQDDTGSIRITLWNDDADETKLNIKQKDIIKITGGNIEFDEYSSTGYRINTNWNSKITINPEIDDKLKKVLEERCEYIKPVKVAELNERDDEGDEVDIIGRIVSIYEPNEFQKNDGTTGLVRTIEIGDSTGVIRSSFWDDKAELPLKEGDAVKIENPQVKMRENRLEISIGRNTPITKPKEDEIEKLPSFDEIKDMIYKKRKIDEVEEEDQNIKVTAQVAEAYGNKILYEMFPNCNKRVTFSDNAYICDICGEDIKEPNYLMIISCVVEDDTGTMRTTFFRTAAEELIEMTTDEVRDVIEKTGDEGSLEEKVEDLVGQEITIIADASFDEYNEEIRLNAKKVLDKKL